MSETRYPTNALAEYLKERGIKQRWLAEQIGINEMQVSRWARGRTSITESSARAVALVLGVPFRILFTDPNGSDSVPERESA